jgi:hypothetical protein
VLRSDHQMASFLRVWTHHPPILLASARTRSRAETV